MGHTATRLLHWDAAHRVTQHGGKCQKMHGHRYTAEVTCSGGLNDIDVVVDFGLVKERVGTWIDEKWDHGMILQRADLVSLGTYEMRRVEFEKQQGNKVYEMPYGLEPTAEGLAQVLYEIATKLLSEEDIKVTRIRVWETPNCFADYTGES